MQRYLLVLLLVGVTNCSEPSWPCAVYDPATEKVLSDGHIVGGTCQLDQQLRMAPNEPLMTCWHEGPGGPRRCQPGTLDASRRMVYGLVTNKVEW